MGVVRPAKQDSTLLDVQPHMSSMCVLVVEDFAPFRQSVRSTLAERHDVQIIGEVADGLEAAQKTEILEPDLVLLDIGLPTLNGMEAVRVTSRTPQAHANTTSSGKKRQATMDTFEAHVRTVREKLDKEQTKWTQ